MRVSGGVHAHSAQQHSHTFHETIIELTHQYNRCLSLCACRVSKEPKVCLSEIRCVNVLLLLGFSFSCTEIIRRHMMFDHVASFMKDLRHRSFKGAVLNTILTIKMIHFCF